MQFNSIYIVEKNTSTSMEVLVSSESECATAVGVIHS